MEARTTDLAIMTRVQGWYADEEIANAASLTSVLFDTHEGIGPAAVPAAGIRVHGLCVATRVLIGIRLSAAATHSIVIRGSNLAAGIADIETIVAGAVQFDAIQRDIFWPIFQVRVENTSAGPITFRISIRCLPGARGV